MKQYTNDRGITLVVLSIAIIMMLIMSSILVYQSGKGNNIQILNHLYEDVERLEEKVKVYYARYQTIPILPTPYEEVDAFLRMNPNDNEVYYVMDLAALGNLSLHYGKEYEKYKTEPSNRWKDLYLINERSHSIYYAKGIWMDEQAYYTKPSHHTPIELQDMTILTLEKRDANIALLRMQAIDKSIGIQEMTLMVEGEVYQTYEYTKEKTDKKEELVEITLPFGTRYTCYVQTTKVDGSKSQSEEIIIQNMDAITTKEDLEQLALLVNEGTNQFARTNDYLDEKCGFTKKRARPMESNWKSGICF